MAVTALKEGYTGEDLDREDNFHGNQVVYLDWEDHRMFCTALAFPLPPDMPFGALISEIMPTYYGPHPDFARIDWNNVEWKIDGIEVVPDPEKSLADNGVRHKSLIRFFTPGIKGYKDASC